MDQDVRNPLAHCFDHETFGFDEGERGTYQGFRLVRADSVTRTSNPPRYAFDEAKEVDGVAKTHYLDGNALLEVE